jgi:hypothetical protein
VPEWLKGADCKSAGLRLRWFEPSPAHHFSFSGVKKVEARLIQSGFFFGSDINRTLLGLTSPLKGNRKGQHSIRINDQWRICFRWETDGPHDVEIVDYH